MKNLIQAAAVTLLAASAAQAQQAVQWKVSDGGNGHWYRFVRDDPTRFLPWTAARDRSVAEGGYLACIGSSIENDFVWALVLASGQRSWMACGPRACGPYLGGYRGDAQPDPSAAWEWVDGSPWSFTSWAATEPANDGGTQNYLKYWFDPDSPAADWGDDYLVSSDAYIIEWSADCNNDDIVDYGQILQGQLADLNTDGVPDVCQQPTCADADLFRNGVINGADLGILLSEWGPANANTVSDINSDGFVNGADLGILLSFWGACSS
jgi:hypothetical protein